MSQFTLRSVREASEYTIEYASKYCDISVETMKEYEKDPGIMPISTAIKLRQLYEIPIDRIYIPRTHILHTNVL